GVPTERPVRVVLITLDTLRYDAFAKGGMPLLWARAQRATRFERAYAASTTTQPTHASLLTGLHPWQHGVTRNGQVLDDRFETVPERLRDAGFATHAVVASYPVAAAFGFAQGFATFREDFTTGLGAASAWEGHRLPRGTFFSDARTVTDRALEALDAADAQGAARQFFWFHYFDPHAPYGGSRGGELMESHVHARIRAGEPRADVMREVRRLYAGDVAFLDAELGRLLERLDRDAAGRDTHVVVTADHGESLGEHGSLGHGYGLGEVEVRVPALVWSQRLERGVRRQPVGSVDLAATLLALAGVPPASEPGAGRDLTAPQLAPAQVAGMRRTFRSRGVGERLLDGNVRPIPDLLFYVVGTDGRRRQGNGKRLLGLAAAEDEEALTRFRGFEQALARNGTRGSPEPEVEARLRALGYVP
ncbi:MAG: sulfatase, partial [Myxococcota bacterium]